MGIPSFVYHHDDIVFGYLADRYASQLMSSLPALSLVSFLKYMEVGAIPRATEMMRLRCTQWIAVLHHRRKYRSLHQ